MNLRGKLLSELGIEKREVMGLDIGLSQVKLIQLCKDNGGYAVTAAGVAEIAASEGSNKRRRITTLSAIRQCLEMTGIKTDLAVCSVSGPEVAVRHFEFPPSVIVVSPCGVQALLNKLRGNGCGRIPCNLSRQHFFSCHDRHFCFCPAWDEHV